MSSRRKPKYAKQKESGLVPALIVITLLAIITAVIVLVLVGRPSAVKQPASPGASNLQETGQPAEAAETAGVPMDVRFPYALEDDGLELTSLFRYTGNNPDCGWAEGTDVGAVILKNETGRYLETLNLAVIMADGTVLSFMASNIPHGKTVQAFERENTSYDDTAEVAEIRCETTYRNGNGLVPDKVKAVSEGMNITLTNVSGETLAGLGVRCHNILDGVYFGGTSYTYPVAEIPADGSIVVVAADCVLGDVGIARIDYRDELIRATMDKQFAAFKSAHVRDLRAA